MAAKLTKPRVLLIGVVALVALFAVVYFALFDTDSPSKLTLQTKGSTLIIRNKAALRLIATNN